MSLKVALARLGASLSFVKPEKTVLDPTPIEVSPRLAMPNVNSLDGMRQAIEILSREKQMTEGETFEEFWDFGQDSEFADLEEMPAPAQMQAHALMEAFTRDFKTELEESAQKAHAEAREKLKAELRRELDLQSRLVAAKDVPPGESQAEPV